MQRSALTLSLALLLALPCRADALSDLKARLAQLQGKSPVKAWVDRQMWNKSVEDKKPVEQQGSARALAEDGPSGFRLAWAHPLLQQVTREQREQARNPERTSPTEKALKEMDAVECYRYMNYAEALLHDFETMQAQVQEERADTLDGQPVRLVILKTQPRMPEQMRKLVKELQVTAKLWLGQDGLPVAFTSSFRFKGSKFFVSFEGSQSQDLRFAHVGDRLVATRVTQENYSSGMGHVEQGKTITSVAVN